MLKLFLYDNAKSRVMINEPDILLIKEFSDLWNNDRNKTKEDKTGDLKSRAFRELKYIYLAIDWRSPYNQYVIQEKHKMALVDSELTDEEFNDPTFRAACRKYDEMLSTSIVGSLLQSQYNVIYKMKLYYDSIDLTLRDDKGELVYKAKDVLSELSNTAKALDGIKSNEDRWKKEQEEEISLAGGVTTGFMEE